MDRYGPHGMEYLNRPIFKHPPVYPLVIALSYLLLGSHVFAALLPSLIAWMGICLLTRRIAASLFGPTVGVMAFLLCVVDPMGWALSQKIYAECVLTFLCLWGLWLYLQNFRSGSLVLCGAVLGLGCLVKYQALIYLLAMLLHLGVVRSYRKMFWLGLSFLLVLSPWIAIQWAVYGVDLWTRLQADFFIAHDFALQTTILGVLCYFILQPLLAHLAKRGFWDKPIISVLARWVLFLVMAIPIAFFGNQMLKIFLWNGLPITSFLRSFSIQRGFYFFQPLLYLPFLILVPMAPLLITKPANRSQTNLLFALSILFFCIATIWENPQIRYLYPVVPVLIILASAAGQAIWNRLSAMAYPLSTIGRFSIACLAFFLLAKILQNDWFFGFVNQAGRF